jgi:hypothetical protein
LKGWKEIVKLKSGRGLVCVFCGMGFGYAGQEPDEETLKDACEHEAHCPKNPYLEEIAELKNLNTTTGQEWMDLHEEIEQIKKDNDVMAKLNDSFPLEIIKLETKIELLRELVNGAKFAVESLSGNPIWRQAWITKATEALKEQKI